jgi:hypothetical protein
MGECGVFASFILSERGDSPRKWCVIRLGQQAEKGAAEAGTVWATMREEGGRSERSLSGSFLSEQCGGARHSGDQWCSAAAAGEVGLYSGRSRVNSESDIKRHARQVTGGSSQRTGTGGGLSRRGIGEIHGDVCSGSKAECTALGLEERVAHVGVGPSERVRPIGKNWFLIFRIQFPTNTKVKTKFKKIIRDLRKI